MLRIARLAALLLVAVTASACGGNDTPTSPSANVPFTTTDLRVGTGTEATNGRRVSVNYVGWLYASGSADNKGKQFDLGSIGFTLGGGQVITGWDRGIVGMRVGGQRRLIIPPDLAYGSAGAGNGAIPGNSTLIFDVELTAVQ